MMAVNVLPPRESTSTPETNFGPDVSNTPKAPPKINEKNPPRSADSVIGKLGQNKKLRSPVRKLTRPKSSYGPDETDTSDYTRLADRYRQVGKIARLFHPKVGTAMIAQADECADSWLKLAENNDTVRRYILAVVEGGDWGGVFAAHIPIVMAVIPERALEQFFMKGMGLFAANVETDDDQFVFEGYEVQ
jgi:hypothetical protein